MAKVTYVVTLEGDDEGFDRFEDYLNAYPEGEDAEVLLFATQASDLALRVTANQLEVALDVCPVETLAVAAQDVNLPPNGFVYRELLNSCKDLLVALKAGL